MKTAAALPLILLLTGLLTQCKKLEPSNDGSSSGLSSVTIGQFTPGEGQKDWQSGQVFFVEKTSKKTVRMFRFTKTSGLKEESVSLPSNKDYFVRFELFEDDARKNLIYFSCRNEMNEEISHHIAGKEVNLSIEICAAEGKVGNTPNTSTSVKVDPILKNGNTGNSQTSTDVAQQKLNAESLAAARTAVENNRKLLVNAPILNRRLIDAETALKDLTTSSTVTDSVTFCGRINSFLASLGTSTEVTAEMKSKITKDIEAIRLMGGLCYLN